MLSKGRAGHETVGKCNFFLDTLAYNLIKLVHEL